MPSFGAPDVDWQESVSLTAWADRIAAQRAAARAGRLVPLVLVSRTGDFLGEISFAIDPRTGDAELSIWLSRNASAPARAWAWRSALDIVLTLPTAVHGVVAPVAVTNQGPARMLTELGFTRRATAKHLRLFQGVPADHDIWWLPRTTPADMASVLAPLAAGRSWAATRRSCALMTLPCARVAMRRGRQLLRRSALPAAQPPSARECAVRLPDDGLGTVTIYGAAVGVADVRHDHGSSTLEVWTSLNHLSAAHHVARELLDLADTKGARRLAWSVLPGSVEQAAATSIGLVREGQTSPPVWATGTPHELWARVLSESPIKLPPATELTNPQPKES